jgi:23S rRNA pseudouridine2605 synthase
MSKLLSSPLLKLANGKRMPPMSRREAERLIRAGQVSIGGQVVTKPHHLLDSISLLSGEEGRSKSTNTAVTVRGKAFSVNVNDVKVFLRTQDGDDDDGASFARRTNPKLAATRVWIAHKLSGEIVSDADPHGRPSLLQRLTRGGVGRLRDGTRLHLKPIGRLDMTTEGLILMTNDGQYARDMELPESGLHRTYRARVHGPLDGHRIRRIQGGVTAPDGTRYAPMRVSADPTARHAGTNKWVEVTCTEGKNRQIRKVFSHLGRTSILICSPRAAVDARFDAAQHPCSVLTFASFAPPLLFLALCENSQRHEVDPNPVR